MLQESNILVRGLPPSGAFERSKSPWEVRIENDRTRDHDGPRPSYLASWPSTHRAQSASAQMTGSFVHQPSRSRSFDRAHRGTCVRVPCGMRCRKFARHCRTLGRPRAPQPSSYLSPRAGCAGCATEPRECDGERSLCRTCSVHFGACTGACVHVQYGSSIGMVGQYKTIFSLDVWNSVLWHAQLRS